MAPVRLLFGATGYIGGSLLVDLKKQHPEWAYTALVRNPRDITTVEALGVKVSEGNHKEIDKIRRLAEEHDVIVNAAHSDDMAMTAAIVEGMNNRAKGGGRRKPVFLHISGAGLLTGGINEGRFIPDHPVTKVWDDTDLNDVMNIPPEAIHRNVDLAIFEAGASGHIDTYVIAPATVYGKGYGPVRYTSVQVNDMIRVALKRREVLYIGEGTNVWTSVHIKDFSDLFLLILHHALTTPSSTAQINPFTRFYFGTVQEYVWGDVAKELARLLHPKGLVATSRPRSVGMDCEGEKLHPKYTGSNARAVSNRGFALGWKPRQKSLMETLPEEVEITVPASLS